MMSLALVCSYPFSTNSCSAASISSFLRSSGSLVIRIARLLDLTDNLSVYIGVKSFYPSYKPVPFIAKHDHARIFRQFIGAQLYLTATNLFNVAAHGLHERLDALDGQVDMAGIIMDRYRYDRL